MPRAGANFELERVEIEDGRLVVSGWWSGVRGMRFVRPALLVDGRQILATLEHKPWAPGGDTPWTAAFPWKGDDTDLTGVTLVVAPSVIVALGPEAEEPTAAEPDPEPPASEAEPQPPAPPAHEAELIRLRARVRDLESTVGHERQTTNSAVAERDHAGQRRTAAERERDHAIAQRDEAITDRDAAARSRERMEAERTAALAALEAAEAQRDEAIAQREEARAQRDEVLLAHNALQQHVNAQLADRERGQPVVPRAEPEPKADADPDQPIGVRTIPAARLIAGDLHRPEPGLGPSKYDMWAMRVLGTTAAVCFVLLLVMILRAFL